MMHTQILHNSLLKKEQYHQLLGLIQKNIAPTASALTANSITASFDPMSSLLKTSISYLPKALSAVLNIPKYAWILDTGAIDHITNSIKKFKSCRPISNIYVKLPNEQTTHVSYIGDIYLSPTLILRDVLCRPICFQSYLR